MQLACKVTDLDISHTMQPHPTVDGAGPSGLVPAVFPEVVKVLGRLPGTFEPFLSLDALVGVSGNGSNSADPGQTYVED